MKTEKNNKIILGIFAIVFITIAGLFFASYREPVSYPSVAEVSNPVTGTDTIVDKKVILPLGDSHAGDPTVTAENKSGQNQIVQKPAENLINVTLAVGNNGSTLLTTGKYDISVQKGATVYDAMTKLASSTCGEACRTTQFSFSARYYSGLGYFIDAINGVKNANGYYWTLYVNGTYATVGASAYQLSANDSIEWKYTNKPNY